MSEPSGLTIENIIAAATLQRIAYDDAYSSSSLSAQTNLKRLDGWIYVNPASLTDSGSTNSLGYFSTLAGGQALIAYNVQSRVLAVAFRGTEFELTGSAVVDILADASLVVPHLTFSAWFGELVRDAIWALDHPFLNVTNDGVPDELISPSKLLITGHSFGGSMVEAALATYEDSRIVGVSFGSPGTNDLYSGQPQDYRLINIGHDGLPGFDDPVYRLLSIVSNSLGFDLRVRLPDVSTIPNVLSQHAKALYESTGQRIAGLLTLALDSGHAIDLRQYHYVLGTDIDKYRLEGNSKANVLIGDSGTENLYGKAGNDVLFGGGGSNLLDGGEGEDVLFGGDKSDTLIGGLGNDTLVGGSGTDTVKYLHGIDQYNIEVNATGDVWRITAKLGGLSNEGSDTISRVEKFDFAGTLFRTEELQRQINPTPIVTPTPTVVGPGGGTTISTADADIAGTSLSQVAVIPGTASLAGVPVISSIDAPGDVDYVRVQLVQGVTYRILVEGFAANGRTALPDTFFRVRDGRDLSLLTPVALSPTGSDSHDQVDGNNARIDFVAPYSGLYFISVGAGGPNFGSLTGQYRLSVTLSNVPGSTPANQNPVITGESFNIAYGQTMDGNLLANDQDPDGNFLGTDAVSNGVTFAGARITVLANGSFQYIAPASGWGETDFYTYTVRDGAGGSAQGLLTINLAAPTSTTQSFSSGNDVVVLPNSSAAFFMLDGHDVVTGSTASSQTVYGGTGNDTFYGTGVGSHYFGGPGDDWFYVSPTGVETDYFFGGDFGAEYDDTDTMDYSRLSSGVNITFANGTADKEDAVGTPFADTFIAHSNDNRISGMGGNDLIDGLAGDDTLYGNAGADNLGGGLGNDSLFGGADDDQLHGGDGSDRLEGDGGSDILHGGAGSDILNGGEGSDSISGEGDSIVTPGDDYIRASAGNDSVNGGGGFDTIDFSDAPTFLSGGFNRITISGWGTTALDLGDVEEFVLTPFNDDINTGGANVQILRLGAGDDRASIQTAGIAIYGDEGNDNIDCLGTDSTAYGGDGADVIIFWTTGSTASGGDANDVLYSQYGDSDFRGDDGNDTLYSGTGNDQMDGGRGDDRIEAGSGNDTLLGQAGDDTLLGQSGADTLDGGAGVDVLDGGSGDDVLSGGADADTFVFGSTGNGLDRIADFSEGDKILLHASVEGLPVTTGNGTSVSNLRTEAITVGGVTTLSIDTNNIVGADVVIKLDGVYTPNQFRFEAPATGQTAIRLNLVPLFTGGISTQGTNSGSPFSFGLSNSVFRDPEGDPLSYTATLSGGSPLPSWLTFNPVTMTFSGTPNTNDVGTLAIQVIANDPFGSSVAGTFKLGVLPVAFDPLAYIASYADLRNILGANSQLGFQHYIDNGQGEGRGITFDAWRYLASYSDLRGAFGANTHAATVHFIQHGAQEGRTLSFDAQGYWAMNPAARDAAGTNLTELSRHYVTQGAAAGLTSQFDPLRYIASYVDLRSAFGINIDAANAHFRAHGFAEGRIVSFDPWSYLASFADLRIAFGTNTHAATTHFIQHGANEGRLVSFNSWAYLASYADLRNVFGTNPQAAARHFVEYGAAEGRAVTFDAWGYLASYADLRGVFGADPLAGAMHFVQHGMGEGRQVTFDAWAYLASYADLQGVFGINTRGATVHFVQHGASEGRSISFDGTQYVLRHADLFSTFGLNTDTAAMHFITNGRGEGRATTLPVVNGTADANTLSGDGNANLLNALAGADTLYGMGGNDLLVGGLGADTLTGGASNDVFRFNSPSEGGDTITDFASGVDKIQFARASFGFGASGVLAPIHFSNTDSASLGAHAGFVYTQGAGQLAFDPDGAGAATPVVIALLGAGTALASSDIWLS